MEVSESYINKECRNIGVETTSLSDLYINENTDKNLLGTNLRYLFRKMKLGFQPYGSVQV